MKKALVFALKLAVTTALLWMIFREHRFTGAILPHLRTIPSHWGAMLAGLASMGVSTWLCALRWQVLLRGQGLRVPGAEVLRVTVVSGFFNITSLGAAGGDAYRVLAIARRERAPRVAVVASVLLDHMLGMVGLAVLFLGCSFVFRDLAGSLGVEVRAIVKGFSVFMAGALGGIVASVILFSPRLYRWGEGRWPRVLGWQPLKDFAHACDAMRRDPRGSLAAAALSVLIFLTQFLSFYFAIFAVGGRAPLLEVMAAMPIVDAAAGLPMSVSGLGVREKTFETLIHALTGLPSDTAVSASLAGWLIGVAWGLLGGLLFTAGSRAESSAADAPEGDD